MNDYEMLSTRCEAVKVGMRQTVKDGHILYLSLNPADAPEDLLRDPPGTRYMAVFVRLNENEQPVPSASMEEGTRAMQVAGALCRDENFQAFMVAEGHADEISEAAATTALRQIINVKSRVELKSNAIARRKLFAVREAFAASYARTGRRS